MKNLLEGFELKFQYLMLDVKKIVCSFQTSFNRL